LGNFGIEEFVGAASSRDHFNLIAGYAKGEDCWGGVNPFSFIGAVSLEKCVESIHQIILKLSAK
jgi:hypothetical protein